MYIIIRDNFEHDGDYYILWIDEGQPVYFRDGKAIFTTIDLEEHEIPMQDIIEIGG